MRKVNGVKHTPARRHGRPAAAVLTALPTRHTRSSRVRLRPPPSRIRNGDMVAALDSNGITWFGVAMGEVEHHGRPWPAIRIRVGQQIISFPARDVTVWPAP